MHEHAIHSATRTIIANAIIAVDVAELAVLFLYPDVPDEQLRAYEATLAWARRIRQVEQS